MSKLFEIPKNLIRPRAMDKEAGEELLTVAFDLGLKTGEQPIAMVFEKCEGQTHIRKLLKDDDALELHRLLTE